MSTGLLATKLYAPILRAGLVPRPRLIERLTAGLTGRLTLVSAPAGFGKTTLVAAWLHDFGFGILDFGLGAHRGGDSPVPGKDDGH